MGGKGSKRRDVDEVVKDNFDKLASIPGVTAVDSGEQIKGGKETNKKVIKVYVEEKKSKNDLQDSEKIPQKIEGHKVDVEEGKGHILGVGKEFLVEWREDKPVGANLPKPYHGPEQVSEEHIESSRPLVSLRGGDSIGVIEYPEVRGSLTYFVKKGNTTGILLSAHCAREIGSRIMSPAVKEGGENKDFIATTKTISVTEEVDCAFASLRGKITKFSLKDASTIKGIAVAQVGDGVKYYSNASDRVVTASVVKNDWEGEVDGMQWSKQIQLDKPALPGDAGALVVKSDTNEAIGMLFANADGKALANNFRVVLNALGVELAIDEDDK